jgi:hypothetical protein
LKSDSKAVFDRPASFNVQFCFRRTGSKVFNTLWTEDDKKGEISTKYEIYYYSSFA